MWIVDLVTWLMIGFGTALDCHDAVERVKCVGTLGAVKGGTAVKDGTRYVPSETLVIGGDPGADVPEWHPDGLMTRD